MSIIDILNILYLNKRQFSELMEKRLKISKEKPETVTQWPKENGQRENKQWPKGIPTMVNKIAHRKPKTEQHEPH